MIGKVVVKTKNPPCKYCGGMGGYHREDECLGNVPKILDKIADSVLAYHPKPKSKAAKKRKRK